MNVATLSTNRAPATYTVVLPSNVFVITKFAVTPVYAVLWWVRVAVRVTSSLGSPTSIDESVLGPDIEVVPFVLEIVMTRDGLICTTFATKLVIVG